MRGTIRRPAGEPAPEVTEIRDSINLRRHRNACKYYREDWRVPNVLYRCYCLLDMPPETSDEQEKCLKSKEGCWRFKEAAAKVRRDPTTAGV